MLAQNIQKNVERDYKNDLADVMKAWIVSLKTMKTNMKIKMKKIIRWTHPILRSYWKTGNLSVSINYVANVMTRERLEETLSKLHFSSNEEHFSSIFLSPKKTKIMKERLKCKNV